MAFNREKTLKAAEKLLGKGNVEKAIKEYLKIVESSPKDISNLNKIGDLYTRIKKIDEAIGMYGRAAAQLSKDGFYLKAIAILKKINKLDPSRMETYEKLAELYSEQGLTNEAKSHYQMLSERYLEAGETKKTLKVLQKIAEMEPDNLQVRAKLADMHAKNNQTSEALTVYAEIGEQLTGKGMYEEAVKVYVQAQQLGGTGVAVLQGLANAYIQLGDSAKALEVIQPLVQREPKNVEYLSLLGDCYLKCDRLKEADATFSRVFDLDDTRVEGLFRVSRSLVAAGQVDESFRVFLRIVDTLMEHDQKDEVQEYLESTLKSHEDYLPALEMLVEKGPSFLMDEKFLQDHMYNLVEAYLAEDRKEEAVKVLEQLLEMEPDNSQYEEKLNYVRGQLYGGGTVMDAGFEPPAAPTAPPPVEVPEPEEELVVEPEEEVDLEIDLPEPVEQVAEVADLAASEEPGTIPPAAPAPTPTPAPATTPSFGDYELNEQEMINEHLTEAEVFAKYGLLEKAVEQLRAALAQFPKSMELHEGLKQLYLQEQMTSEAVEVLASMVTLARKKGQTEQADGFLEEAQELAPDHPALQALAGGTAAPAAAPPAAAAPDEAELELDLDDSLEESLEDSLAEAVDEESSLAEPMAAPVAGEEVEEEFDLGESIGKSLEEELAPEAMIPESAEEPDEDPEDDSGSLATELEMDLGENLTPVPEEAGETTTPPGVGADAGFDDLEVELDGGEKDLGSATQLLPADETGEETTPPGELVAAEGREIDMETMEEEDPSVASAFRDIEGRSEDSLVRELEQLDDVSAVRPHEASSADQLSEALEELDFYVSQGFHEDAKRLLSTLMEQYPDNPEIQEKLEVLGLGEDGEAMSGFLDLDDEDDEPWELDIDESFAADPGDILTEMKAEEAEGEPAPDAEPAPESEPEYEGFDDLDFDSEEEALDGTEMSMPDGEALAEAEPEAPPAPPGGELDDETLIMAAIDAEPVADESVPLLEEMVSDFKKGVHQDVDAADADTHFDLGIAYKEMGLVDEAIAEFQYAAKDPKRHLQCCSLIASCFKEKGIFEAAEKWYGKGLDTPERTAEQTHTLKYDLADLYEQMGESVKARDLYTEIQVEDASFRDVADRLKVLSDTE